jgi:aminoglycoside phosphotransferase (APT) family kinase protein
MSALPVPGTLSLRGRIAALLEDPLDQALARSILGTTSVEEIAARVEDYCREHLGAGVRACASFGQSVGAVFVLGLESGATVVLKAHGPDESRWGTAGSLRSLGAAYRVQEEAASRGFPCASVLRAPTAWAHGCAATMSYREGGGSDDPHRPEARRAMAESGAELVRLLQDQRALPDLPIHRLPADRLWPKPHNVLFDLDRPGADWIDERARRARAILDAVTVEPVLIHTDVSAANVRVRGGRVVAVYDMDSVALGDEAQVLASMAVHHTYTGEEGRWTWPSRAEACAFVADYERARGAPFSLRFRERMDAAAIYALGYTARAEHSGDPRGERFEGSIRQILSAAPDRYFDGAI